MSTKAVVSAFLLSAITVSALADTVYVDATGETPGSYTTLTSAINSTATEILVKNTGAYAEVLPSITRSVTIKGENPADRPIVIPNQSLIIGAVQQTEDISVVLEDLIVIPRSSAVAPAPFPLIWGITGPDYTLTARLNNLLAAPNNGSDQPSATSVWEDPIAGLNNPSDHGILFARTPSIGSGAPVGTAHVDIEDVTVIGLGRVQNGSGFRFDAGTSSTLNIRGLHTSYAHTYGMIVQRHGQCTISGTRENPGLIARRNANFGLSLRGNSSDTIDHAVIIENSNAGFRVPLDFDRETTITNSLIANNRLGGIVVDTSSASSIASILLQGCTFFRNGFEDNGTNIRIYGDQSIVTLDIVDSIVAGAGTYGIRNESTSSTINLTNSAVVTTGPDALAGLLHPSSTGAVNFYNVIHDDPAFVNRTIDPPAANSFDVSNSVFIDASSTSGPLNGWGDGPYPTTVRNWMQYGR